MATSNYIKKINNYKKCMNILECAHCVYIDEIKFFEFKKISKYSKSKNMYAKITEDFAKVNELIQNNDLFNAATILRTLYENIIYIIATSFDKKTIIKLDTSPKELRMVLENNFSDLFFDYFQKDDLNNIYKYLCKLVHPCSLKELVSYLSNTIKYKPYMLNNLKYIMVIIEFLYLNYLNKKIDKDLSEFEIDFIDCCTYINLVNISYFLNDVKEGMNVVKRYMYYDTDNKYIDENKKICKQLYDEIKNNRIMIEKNINELTKRLDKQINNSKYKELINNILK